MIWFRENAIRIWMYCIAMYFAEQNRSFENKSSLFQMKRDACEATLTKSCFEIIDLNFQMYFFLKFEFSASCLAD